MQHIVTKAAQQLLNRQSLQTNPFLVYRLTPVLELPLSLMVHPKALGSLAQDHALLVRALANLPFVKVSGNRIRLMYKNSFRRVLVSGITELALQKFVRNYSGRAPFREKDEICAVFLCQTREDAERFCLYLRDCKRASESKKQRIKLQDHPKIRISLEHGRLYQLMVQYIEKRKAVLYDQRFQKEQRAIRYREVCDHWEIIQERSQTIMGEPLDRISQERQRDKQLAKGEKKDDLDTSVSDQQSSVRRRKAKRGYSYQQIAALYKEKRAGWVKCPTELSQHKAIVRC